MISFRKECLNFVTVQIYSISPAPPNNSPPFVRNPSLVVRNDNHLLTQFRYLAIICWVVWRLYIWLFGMHSFGNLNFNAPPCPSTRSIFRIHSTTRLYFPLCYIYYFTVENFLNHSQYLTTVYPSTFYGEGF